MLFRPLMILSKYFSAGNVDDSTSRTKSCLLSLSLFLSFSLFDTRNLWPLGSNFIEQLFLHSVSQTICTIKQIVSTHTPFARLNLSSLFYEPFFKLHTHTHTHFSVVYLMFLLLLTNNLNLKLYLALGLSALCSIHELLLLANSSSSGQLLIARVKENWSGNRWNWNLFVCLFAYVCVCVPTCLPRTTRWLRCAHVLVPVSIIENVIKFTRMLNTEIT